MQRPPLVTIVTPSYNQGQFIRATIESVLNQDYSNIEYIIMDGGSTDDTAKVASEYADHLIFISEGDRGQSHAINKGFRMARGEIVAWLNSDDIILPGAVTLAVKAFQRNPKIGAVYGEGSLIDYHGGVKGRFPATIPFNLWFLIHASDYILQQTTYFRREIFDKIGFLDENLNWGMDWDLLIRIGKKHPIEYIPQSMGCLREYDEAKTFSGGRRRFRELVKIMRRHGDLRFPPGYFIYGLSTYEQLICRHLPFAFMRSIVRYAASSIYLRVLDDCQGLYRDGWAGRRLRYMLPPGSGYIRISGTVPPWRAFKKQVLTVRVGDTYSKGINVPFGDFCIEISPPRGSDSHPVSIEIAAAKVKRPNSADRRKLAFLLKGIEWVEQIEFDRYSESRCRLAGEDASPLPLTRLRGLHSRSRSARRSRCRERCRVARSSQP